MDSGLLYELGSLVPPVCTGLLFWFVMRAILRADRREREAERLAEREWEAEHASGSDSRTDQSGSTL